ncbi:hypothetical protein LCGC14_1376690 [marine sediment metagenome]|uniref:Uncharacterized protein n=1 Tax=marine sediment metagenome TaxID=412755 RepID=A0A0F9KPU9_9ZZZZ
MPTITERYEAVVSSIDDPQNRGRFKVKCVGLLGDADTELPNFVELVPDHGWFTVPEVGEQVEIEVVVQRGERHLRALFRQHRYPLLSCQCCYDWYRQPPSRRC